MTAVCAGLFGTAVGDLDLTPGMPADAYLIALGILSQSVGYLAIQVSLPRLPAVVASVLLLVQPVTTVFLGAILLRELPSPFQLLGVALVIGGIALATGSLARIGTAIRAGAGAPADPVGLVGVRGAPHLASGLVGRLGRAVVRRQVRARRRRRRGSRRGRRVSIRRNGHARGLEVVEQLVGHAGRAEAAEARRGGGPAPAPASPGRRARRAA